MNKQKITLITAISIVLLSVVSFAIAVFSSLSILESFRIIFGSIYVLFLPGFIISFIFFPKTKKFEEDKETSAKDSIDIIERIALSFALSIAIVPLCVFYLNLIGIKINLLNSFLTILAIIFISLAILAIKSKKARGNNIYT
ncbi:MAG: DUF1616 domain-containing protein [Candidatus Nanoarchaeia archaeon]